MPTQTRLSVWDVTSFGAGGPGDSTSAINSAISSAVGAGGGIVYFPVGKYYINSANASISVRNNVILLGAGPGSQIIGSAMTGDIISVYSSIETYNVAIRDLLITANVAKTSGAAINATRVRGLDIEHVLIGSLDGSGGGNGTDELVNNLWDGIVILHPFHTRIARCIVRAQNNGLTVNAVSSGNSIWTSGYPYYAASDMWVGGGTLIRDCTSTMGGNGILIENGGGNGFQVEETDIYGCRYGITMQGSSTDASQSNGQIFIGHCSIDSCSQEGLVLQNYAVQLLQLNDTWIGSNGSGTSGGGYGCGIWVSSNQNSGRTAGILALSAVVSGCRIVENAGHGLYLNGGYWNVTGTASHGNGTRGSGGYGLYARSLQRFTFVGNTLTDNTSGGINVDTSNNYGVIVGNTCQPTLGANSISASTTVKNDAASNLT